MGIGLKLDDPNIIVRMPHINDIVVKDTGEIKEKMQVIKEYEKFFLCIGQRTHTRECFLKVCFALGEYEIESKNYNI